MASYTSAIPYIQKAEGGLSRATTDTASSNPSPYVYKGVTGWHTNRGITWATFKGLSTEAGYQVSEKNFIYMPDSVWLAIYKIGYWNPMKGDNYTSQAIANAVVDFAWASGVGGSSKALKKYLGTKGIVATDSIGIANGFNQLVKKQGEAKVFNDLIEERKRFFKSLNQPANEKGWLNRMETLRQEGSKLIGEFTTELSKNKLPTILIAAGSVLILMSLFIKK